MTGWRGCFISALSVGVYLLIRSSLLNTPWAIQTRVCVDLWVHFESWSVLNKTQGLSPTLSLNRSSSSPTSAWVLFSVESLCFLWSLLLDGFTAVFTFMRNISGFIIGLFFGWPVFSVSVCFLWRDRKPHFHWHTSSAFLSLFHALLFYKSLFDFLISAISGEFDEAMKYGLEIPHGIGVS